MNQDGCTDGDLSEPIESTQLAAALGPKDGEKQTPSASTADIIVTDHQSSQQTTVTAVQSANSVVAGTEETQTILETGQSQAEATSETSETTKETKLSSSNSTDLPSIEIVESKEQHVGTGDLVDSSKTSEVDQLHSAENIERSLEAEKTEQPGDLSKPNQTTAAESIHPTSKSLKVSQPSKVSEPGLPLTETLQQSAETSIESDITIVAEVKKVDDPKPISVESRVTLIDADSSSQHLEETADTMKEEPVEANMKQEPIDIEEDQSVKGVKDEMDDEDIRDEGFSDEAHEKDDDEIVDNPAYIPKTGRYYMHDSREVDEHLQKRPSRSRADGPWKHDRFDVQSQRPKSRRELLARYGYDIRSTSKQEIGVDDERISESGTRKSHKSTEKTRSPPEIPPTRSRGGRGRQFNADRGDSDRRRQDNRASFDSRRNVVQDDEHDGHDAHRFDRGKRTGMNRRYQQSGQMMRGGRGDYASRGDRDDYVSRGDRVTRNDRVDYVSRGRAGTNGFRQPHSRGNDRRPMRSGRENVFYTSRGAPAERREPYEEPRSGAPGGKRYSTQRVVCGSYVNENIAGAVTKDPGAIEEPNAVPRKWSSIPSPPQQQHVVPPPQQTIVPPPPLVVGPPLGNMQQPPPAAAPLVGYPCNNIVYFDPHQQMTRNPIPPRSRKRLEIVPPSQKN